MNETESTRFHHLRQQALRGVALSPEATDELSGYMAKLESEERELLQPAHHEQQTRIADTEQRIAELRQLTARREALAAYLRQVEKEVSAESEAIDSAFRRLFGTAAVTAMAGVR